MTIEPFNQIRTYKDLLVILQQASEEQLNQDVQIVKSHCVYNHVYSLEAVICFGTVDGLELKYARSSVDNQRHGEELILFTDGNGFAEDGATSHTMIFPTKWERLKRRIHLELCNFIGARSKSDIFFKGEANYPKNHSERSDWTGPAQKIADEENQIKDTNPTLVPILQKRTENS